MILPNPAHPAASGLEVGSYGSLVGKFGEGVRFDDLLGMDAGDNRRTFHRPQIGLVCFDLLACDRDQQYLMLPSVVEWLPAAHLAWFVIDAAAEFNLSAFYAGFPRIGCLPKNILNRSISSLRERGLFLTKSRRSSPLSSGFY